MEMAKSRAWNRQKCRGEKARAKKGKGKSKERKRQEWRVVNARVERGNPRMERGKGNN